MREIVLDTETTGIDPAEGHRLVEIGCVELMNYVPTGRVYHVYLNPEREVPPEAEAVHGLSTRFLRDKPLFTQVYTDLIAFIDGAALVIHNAEFDVKFLNAELGKMGHPGFRLKEVVDTLKIAREKFPGSPANLDALCRRFGVDNTGREYHGALLDSQLLAEVYLELRGGRQHGLGLVTEHQAGLMAAISVQAGPVKKPRDPRVWPLSPAEIVAHQAMAAALTDSIWKDY